jgi:chemotaxis signal transduction protein
MELPAAGSADNQTHILFRLGAYTLALPLTAIRSVDRPGRFTAIPFATPWLRGVTAVGGAVVSVVDLGRFAGGSPAGMSPGARLVVARWGTLTTGLLVDGVTGLAPLPGVLSPIPGVTGPLVDYWRGAHTVDGEVVLVLDPQRLFQSPAFHTYQLSPAHATASDTAITASLPE